MLSGQTSTERMLDRFTRSSTIALYWTKLVSPCRDAFEIDDRLTGFRSHQEPRFKDIDRSPGTDWRIPMGHHWYPNLELCGRAVRLLFLSPSSAHW